MSTSKMIVAGGIAWVILAGNAWAGKSAETALAERAQAVLIRAVNEEKAFIQVHAADALVAVGHPAPAWKVFSALVPVEPTAATRVGVWRSLAGSAPTPEERAAWVRKIEEEFMNPDSNLRVGAIESLGKIGHVMSGPALEAARAAAANFSEFDATFVWWALHLTGDARAVPALVKALDSTDSRTRGRAAYALRALQTKDPRALNKIAQLAEEEDAQQSEQTRMRSIAVGLNADPKRTPRWQALLERELEHGSPGAQYDACFSLMHRYTPADLHRLAPLLQIPSGDPPIGAAWAILHVLKNSRAAN